MMVYALCRIFFYITCVIHKWVTTPLCLSIRNFVTRFRVPVLGLVHIIICLASLQANAQSVDKVYQLNIPSQSLIESLSALSEVTNRLSLFPYELVKTKQSKRLVGFYTAQQALDILLDNSGLVGQLVGDDIFILEPQVDPFQGNIERDVSNDDHKAVSSATVIASDANIATEDVEIINVYRSMRRSFDGSIGIKRIADTVVDAITVEDIGQFPDDSVAGAIQRIPGVQIETDDSGTQGDRVSIRGLGPEFVTSTVNGRRLLSAGTEASSLRQMNFNIFPANILGGVQIAKGQTAARPEHGLAGHVDLQTLKPLEIERLDDQLSMAAMSWEGRYQDISNQGGQRFSLISGARNDDKSLGAYFAVVYADEHNARDQIRVNSSSRKINFDETGDGLADSFVFAFAPRAITFNPIRENPIRTAISAAIQYKPNDDLNVNWDLVYSKYQNTSERQSRQILIANTYSTTVFDNSDPANLAFISDDNKVVKFLDYGESTGAGNIWDILKGFQYNNKTENIITGVNVDYFINDLVNMNVDVYYSSVDYDQDLRTTNIRKELSREGFIYDATGDIANFRTSDSDELDGYEYWRSSLRPILYEAQNHGFTVAFNTMLQDHPSIRSVDYGMHYNITDIQVKATNFYQLMPENSEQARALTAATLPGTLIDQDFLANNDYTPTRWFYSDFTAAVTVDPRIAETTLADIGLSRSASYRMSEGVFSLFTQVNLEAEWFTFPLTGNLGVRAIYTLQEGNAYEFINNIETPVSSQGDYWEYLPSLNLSFSLQDDVILRLGLSKSLTRPDYEQMAPIKTIINPTDENNNVGSAIFGNPKLDPMTSINVDLTLQMYTEQDSAFVFSLFRKYVSDYVHRQTLFESELSGHDGLFDITTYSNFSDGTAQGYEISWYQPFDKILPVLEGFGISTNYTYVDSEFDKDVGDAGFGFPGPSKDNVNFTAFYDQPFYSIRLAYVYRSEFFRQLAGSGAQTDSAIFTQAQGKLDLSIIIRPIPDLSFRISASNITDESRRDFVGIETTFLEYYERGKSYSLTASYSF